MTLTLTANPPANTNKARYLVELAKKTGLDPLVLGAWTSAEEPGVNTTTRGDQNWLNIGQTDSGPIGIAHGAVWRDPISAADATAAFINGTWGGASPGIRKIASTAGKDPQTQINAIGSSGWATDPKYKSTIQSLYDSVRSSGQAAKIAQQGGSDATTGGAAGGVGGLTGIGGLSSTLDVLKFLASAVKFLVSSQFLYIIAGGLLVVLGLIFLFFSFSHQGKSFGTPVGRVKVKAK